MRLENMSTRHLRLVRYLLVTSIVGLCLLECVNAYGLGAPDTACIDMTPKHGQQLQSSPPPYNLLPNTTSVYGGERLSIEIRAQNEPFKGFFLQARENETGIPMGTFYATNQGTDQKIFTCSGKGFNNAVTHSSPSGKNSVKMEWEAPFDFEGDIIFRGTVVKNFTTIWITPRSEKITIRKRSVDSASTRTTFSTQRPKISGVNPTSAASTGIEQSMASIYDGCGQEKSCFGEPNNCVDRKSCKFMTTYTFIGGGKYEFELLGTGGSNRFVSVGLSYDTEMGDDSVVTCKSSSGNLMDISMSWNLGKTNDDIRNPKEGITDLEKGNVDGKLYCKFTRDEITNPNNKKFDLKNDQFHIMIAEGTVSQDNRIQYHGQNKQVSAKLVNLGETSKLEGGVDVNLFRKLHGCFMIAAWVGAASCGILFARYYKQTWLRSRCCNIDQWFHFHRLFMITTWSLTMAALVLIWYGLKQFNASTHSIIGMTSIVLCFIQPFMAALRPHPDGKRRGVFNWLHWFVGNSAQILGITAIFFGYEMYLGQGRNWVKEVAWYTLIAFIAFHCVIHLVLSISQIAAGRKPKSAEIFPLNELSGNRAAYINEGERLDAPHTCFRKFIIGLYLPINWLFAALLILLVVFDREKIENQFRKWKIEEFWKEI